MRRELWGTRTGIGLGGEVPGQLRLGVLRLSLVDQGLLADALSVGGMALGLRREPALVVEAVGDAGAEGGVPEDLDGGGSAAGGAGGGGDSGYVDGLRREDHCCGGACGREKGEAGERF